MRFYPYYKCRVSQNWDRGQKIRLGSFEGVFMLGGFVFEDFWANFFFKFSRFFSRVQFHIRNFRVFPFFWSKFLLGFKLIVSANYWGEFCWIFTFPHINEINILYFLFFWHQKLPVIIFLKIAGSELSLLHVTITNSNEFILRAQILSGHIFPFMPRVNFNSNIASSWQFNKFKLWSRFTRHTSRNWEKWLSIPLSAYSN